MVELVQPVGQPPTCEEAFGDEEDDKIDDELVEDDGGEALEGRGEKTTNKNQCLR